MSDKVLLFTHKVHVDSYGSFYQKPLPDCISCNPFCIPNPYWSHHVQVADQLLPVHWGYVQVGFPLRHLIDLCCPAPHHCTPPGEHPQTKRSKSGLRHGVMWWPGQSSGFLHVLDQLISFRGLFVWLILFLVKLLCLICTLCRTQRGLFTNNYFFVALKFLPKNRAIGWFQLNVTKGIFLIPGQRLWYMYACKIHLLLFSNCR